MYSGTPKMSWIYLKIVLTKKKFALVSLSFLLKSKWVLKKYLFSNVSLKGGLASAHPAFKDLPHLT